MYISNNAIILPVCNIRVEICLYIIIALPRVILFSIPSSLFLTWCSYIKYLSKLKTEVLQAFLLVFFDYGWVVNGKKTETETKPKTYIYSSVHRGHSERLFAFANVISLSSRSYYVSCSYDSKDQTHYSFCYTSLHVDVCISIRLRIRTVISG